MSATSTTPLTSVSADRGVATSPKEEFANAVIQHLDTLFDELALAKIALEEGGEREHRLGSMARSVGAVIDFINNFDEFRKSGLADPLTALLLNLRDVTVNGTLPEDFVLPPAKGVKDTELLKQLRLCCALGMQFYIDAGVDRTIAANRVVQMLPDIKNLRANRVTRWRNELSAGERQADRLFFDEYHRNVTQNRNRAGGRLTVLEVDKKLRRDSTMFKTVRIKVPRRS